MNAKQVRYFRPVSTAVTHATLTRAKRAYAESENDTDDFLLDLDYWLESLYPA